jgi:hypothetical protein
MSKRFLSSVVAVFTVGATLLLSQSAAHASPLTIGEVYGPYILVNEGLEPVGSAPMCLDNPNSNGSDNTRMEIYTCVYNAPNQKWYNETAVTTSDFWTFNGASSKCLTVKGASTAEQAPIIQYGCTTGTNERWIYNATGAEYFGFTLGGHTFGTGRDYHIRSVKSNLCIRPVNAGFTSKTLLEQVDCSLAGTIWTQYPY